jgi:hypothetical protein
MDEAKAAGHEMIVDTDKYELNIQVNRNEELAQKRQ